MHKCSLDASVHLVKLPRMALPTMMCQDICPYLCAFSSGPCLNWCRGGGEGPRQLCSRLGINVHFPTDGRIVTTTRVMEATSSPLARAAPDFHIFHFFAAFVSPCVFFTLFAVPSLFPSVLCRRSFSGTHFFPALTLSGHLHIPHRKFEAKQYHQTVDLTLK